MVKAYHIVILVLVIAIVAFNLERFTGYATDIRYQHTKCLTDITDLNPGEPIPTLPMNVTPKNILNESVGGGKIVLTVDSGCVTDRVYLCKVGKKNPIKSYRINPKTAVRSSFTQFKYCDNNKSDRKLFPLEFEKYMYLENGEYYLSIQNLYTGKYIGEYMDDVHFTVG